MGILLERQLLNAHTKKRAGAFSFLYLLIRLAILSIPLVISYKIDAVNFFGTVAGIFMIQLTILFNNLVVNKVFNIRKV